MALTTIASLTKADRQRLADSLGCADAQLDERLQQCAAAALAEQLDMFLGRKFFPRASDFVEYRLLQLIQANVFVVPTDQNVADLFQLPMPQARTLIRNVYTKYRFVLEEALDEQLKQTLTRARKVNDAQYTLSIESRAVADALNDRLLRYGGLRRVVLEPGSLTRYPIDRASLDTLVKRLGAKPPEGL
jgi:hypothetical protein